MQAREAYVEDEAPAPRNESPRAQARKENRKAYLEIDEELSFLGGEDNAQLD